MNYGADNMSTTVPSWPGSAHAAAMGPDLQAWVRFDADASQDALTAELIQQLADPSSLDWLEPLGFFGETGKRLLVHALDTSGRDLDPRLEESVALGGAKAIELEALGNLVHVSRTHWSYVASQDPAGVDLSVRCQRPSSDSHASAAEVFLQVSRQDLLAPPSELVGALVQWLDGVMAGAWVTCAGVLAKTDPNLRSLGQRLAIVGDPFEPYVLDYSWVVVLPPACIETLGGADSVRVEAPVFSIDEVSSAGGACLRLQVTPVPEDMTEPVLRAWRAYLSPVLAPRRAGKRARLQPEAMRFILDDELTDEP